MTKLSTAYCLFMCKSSRIDVALGLYNKESGKTAVCGTFSFLLHFDVICDLSLIKRPQHGIYSDEIRWDEQI